MPFRVAGHGNGIVIITPKTPVVRCPECGRLFDPPAVAVDTSYKATTGDLSETNDGYVIVRRRFKRAYEESGLMGADFVSLSTGDFVFVPRRRVSLFREELTMKTHGPICGTCNAPQQNLSVTMSYALAEGEEIGDMEVVQSRLPFLMPAPTPTRPRYDSYHLFAGDGFVAAMRRARLRGIAYIKMFSREEIIAKNYY